MSSRYESLQVASFYPDVFHVPAPGELPTPSAAAGGDVWPRRPGVFVRALPVPATGTPNDATADIPSDAQAPAEAEASAQAAPAWRHDLATGQFGLVPRWVKSASDAKLRATKLVNARSETVTTSQNFRDAWLAGQRCIVPMMAFFDDDWRTGKAVPTRIARVDGQPMGVAGLWECWEKNGEVIISYTLLTVNANSHALMHRYQHAGVEKRMPAILSEGAYDAWLNARPDKAKEFMRAYPANWLTANPVEKKGKKPLI